MDFRLSNGAMISAKLKKQIVCIKRVFLVEIETTEKKY